MEMPKLPPVNVKHQLNEMSRKTKIFMDAQDKIKEQGGKNNEPIKTDSNP